MNRILNFILTPLIAVILIIIKIEDWEKEIEELHPYAPTAVNIFLIVATIYNYYITVLSPYKKLQDLKKKRWSSIDAAAKEISDALPDLELSFNIMVPQRKFFCHLEPRKSPKKHWWQSTYRIRFFTNVFEVVWNYGSARVNSKLWFTIQQGCCGESFRDEKVCGYDLEGAATRTPSKGIDFNLNSEQIRLTSDLTMVISHPIFFVNNTPEKQKTTVLGVLNVESRISGAGELLTNKAKRQPFYNGLGEVINTYLYHL